MIDRRMLSTEADRVMRDGYFHNMMMAPLGDPGRPLCAVPARFRGAAIIGISDRVVLDADVCGETVTFTYPFLTVSGLEEAMVDFRRMMHEAAEAQLEEHVDRVLVEVQ